MLCTQFFFIGMFCTILIIFYKLWLKWMFFSSFKLDRETVSVFECGFDGKDISRVPFSLRFFFIIILFMVFDVEISLLLQLPFEFSMGCLYTRFWFMVFLLVLGLGVLEESRRGMLSWKS